MDNPEGPTGTSKPPKPIKPIKVRRAGGMTIASLRAAVSADRQLEPLPKG